MVSSIQSVVWTVIAILVLKIYTTRRQVKSAPGPFLASLTNLWQYYYRRQGVFPTKLKEMHDRYGPIVRYSPTAISVSDPAAVGVVYRTNDVMPKADSYRVMIRQLNGKEVPSIVSTMSESRLTDIKRGINHAFTANTLLDYEDLVDETQAHFLEVISKKPVIDVTRYMQLFTMDVLCRVAFGEALGTLERGDDVNGTMAAIETSFTHWNLWGAFPALENLVFRNRWALARAPKSTSAVAKLASRQISERKATTKSTLTPGKRDLLQKYLEASEKHPETFDQMAVLGVSISTIAAGADTTAVSLAVMIFHLLKTPKTLQKLQREIDEAVLNGNLSSPPKWNEVKNFKYLDAVIKEVLRIHPLVNFPLERVVPAGGVELAGTFFPEGTTVGVSQLAVHLNRDLYGADADKFNPDRWLTVDEGRRNAMERAHLGFGAGKRLCIGRNIALLEMKKFIPNILMNYELSLEDPKQEFRTKPSSIAYPEPIFVKFTPKTS